MIMNRLYRCEEAPIYRPPVEPTREIDQPSWSIGFGLGMALIIGYCATVYGLALVGLYTIVTRFW